MKRTARSDSGEMESGQPLGLLVWVGRLFPIVVSILTIIFLLTVIDLEQAATVLLGADLSYLLLANGSLLLANIVAAWRLSEACGVLNRRHISLRHTIRAHFVGQWFNQILPTGLGGDAVRVGYLESSAGLKRAVRAVLLDRILGLVFLLGITVLFAPVYLSSLRGDLELAVAIVPVLSTLLLIVAVPAALSMPRIETALRRGKLLKFLRTLLNDLYRVVTPPVSWHFLGSTALFLLLSLLGYALCAAAFSEASGLNSFLIGPLVFIYMQIPISYGGWGPRESITILYAGYLGISAESAFLMSVAFGLSLVISAAPGVILTLPHFKTNGKD